MGARVRIIVGMTHLLVVERSYFQIITLQLTRLLPRVIYIPKKASLQVVLVVD